MGRIHAACRCVLLLIMPLFLAACSGPGKRPEAEKQEITFTPQMFEDQTFSYFQDTQVNGGEPVTVTMWVNEDWEDCYRYFLEEYKKYRPNVDVRLVIYPWKSYWIKLRLALSGGNGPDIFHMHNSVFEEYQGDMEPLPEEIFGADGFGTYFDQPGDLKNSEELYSVSMGCCTGGIFYNQRLWREAGLTRADIPATWEELRAVAKKLTKYDAGGAILVDGFNFNTEAQNLLFAMQAQKGIPLFAENGAVTNLFNPETKECAEFLRGLYSSDRVCRIHEAPARELFGEEHAAMVYGWSWLANDLALNYPTVEYGFFRNPTWDGEVPPAYDYNNYEMSFAVNRKSGEAQKEAALDMLLFYLSNDDVLLQVANQAQIVPGKYSLVESRADELSEVIRVQTGYIDRTALKGAIPEAVYSYLRPLVNTDLFEEKYHLDDLLETADEELRKILAQYDYVSTLPYYPHYDEFKTE